MALNEQLSPSRRPEMKKELDVKTQALQMLDRHQDQLKELRQNTVNEEAFESAALKATDAFKDRLEGFLMRNLKEDEATKLFQELTQSLSDDLSQYLNA